MDLAGFSLAETSLADNKVVIFNSRSLPAISNRAKGFPNQTSENRSLNVSRSRNSVLVNRDVGTISNKGLGSNNSFLTIPVKAKSQSVNQSSTIGTYRQLYSKSKNKFQAQNSVINYIHENVTANSKVVARILATLYRWECFDIIEEDQNESQIDEECN